MVNIFSASLSHLFRTNSNPEARQEAEVTNVDSGEPIDQDLTLNQRKIVMKGLKLNQRI
jgi:hypothetical protein